MPKHIDDYLNLFDALTNKKVPRKIVHKDKDDVRKERERKNRRPKRKRIQKRNNNNLCFKDRARKDRKAIKPEDLE